MKIYKLVAAISLFLIVGNAYANFGQKAAKVVLTCAVVGAGVVRCDVDEEARKGVEDAVFYAAITTAVTVGTVAGETAGLVAGGAAGILAGGVATGVEGVKTLAEVSAFAASQVLPTPDSEGLPLGYGDWGF